MTYERDRYLVPRDNSLDLDVPLAPQDEALISRQLGFQLGHLQRQGRVSADAERYIAGLHAYGVAEGAAAFKTMLHQRNQAESQDEFDFTDAFAQLMGSQMVRNIADAAQRGSEAIKRLAEQHPVAPPPPDNRPWLKRHFGG